MEFRDCNQATTSGAGKGTGAEGVQGTSSAFEFPRKGKRELPPIASRNRPRRDAAIETFELSAMRTP